MRLFQKEEYPSSNLGIRTMKENPILKITIEYGEDRVEQNIPLPGISLYKEDWETTWYGFSMTQELGRLLHDIILSELRLPEKVLPDNHKLLYFKCEELCEKIKQRANQIKV